jgi:transcription initiation factor TFIID TATA-box-binding protein
MKWKAFGKRHRSGASDVHCIQDFQVEFDNTYDLKDRNSSTAQVHNLVGTSRIVSNLPAINLLAVSNLLPNSSFEKQKFAAITIRLGQPTCTVLLFTSGKMVLTGCRSLLDCILASRIVKNVLSDGFPGVVFRLDGIKIQNIVGNALLPLLPHERLNLELFYKEFNVFCTYQPNMFPGLIYRPSNIPVVFLVFFSGKVVITGAKTMADVYDSWKKLHDILKNYKIIVTKAKMSDLNTTEV